MNTIRLSAITFALTLSLTAVAIQAETITGRINGHGCAHAGGICPLDRFDPHIALERDFVLQKADGNYLFLTNVPRDTKVRHALKKARVTGELDDRYNAIVVDELQVEQEGEFETVWSQRAQFIEWTYLQGTGGLGPVVGRPTVNH